MDTVTQTSSSVAVLPPGDVAEVVLSLVIVVAAVLVLGWIYGRVHGQRGPRGRVLEVLATQSLGAKERVVLARVGSTRLLIGITPAQIQTLHVLDDDGSEAPEPAAATSFASRLKDALGGATR